MIQRRSKSVARALFFVVFGGFGVTYAKARAQAQAGLRGVTADVAFTYDGTRATYLSGGNFWLQGGALEIHVPFYRGLGMVATVGGAHSGTDTPSIEPLDLVTAVFGPRYTVTSHGGKVSVFGQVLGGEAHGFKSVFPQGSGAVSNPLNGATGRADSVALQVGVGLDFGLTRTLAFRMIQLDYLRTELQNGSTNTQNNLQVGAGLVLRFRP